MFLHFWEISDFKNIWRAKNTQKYVRDIRGRALSALFSQLDEFLFRFRFVIYIRKNALNRPCTIYTYLFA